jgi:hypothetical protein
MPTPPTTNVLAWAASVRADVVEHHVQIRRGAAAHTIRREHIRAQAPVG